MISVIISVSWSGHHPFYCAQMVKACAAFSKWVYVLCQEGADLAAELGAADHLPRKVKVLHFPNRYALSGCRDFGELRDDLGDLRRLTSAAIQAHPGERVFVFHTSLDLFFANGMHLPRLCLNIGTLFPFVFTGLLLAPDRKWPLAGVRASLDRAHGGGRSPKGRPSLDRRAADVILNLTARMLRQLFLTFRDLALRRSHCQRVVLLDERYLGRLTVGSGKKVVLFPEVIGVEVSNDTSKLAEEVHAKKGSATVVGLLGELGERKGMALLLEVIKQCNTQGFLFVLAGRFNPAGLSAELQRFVEQELPRRANVIFSPQRIPSEEEFNLVLHCCDIIYCVYRNHLHSSGLLTKAAALRKPLLVSGGELMAKRVQEYGLGRILPAETPEACLATLKSMREPGYREHFLREGRFEDYTEAHSFRRLQEVMRLLGEQSAWDCTKI